MKFNLTTVGLGLGLLLIINAARKRSKITSGAVQPGNDASAGTTQTAADWWTYAGQWHL